MTVQRSNAKFASFCDRQRQRVQNFAGSIFVWLIAFINDRILPANRPLDAEAIAAWCQQFLAERDAGEFQYRGLPVDPEFAAAMNRPGAIDEFWYRGQRVTVKSAESARPAYLLSAGAEKPFVPSYQRTLKKWIVRADMTDMDRVAATPDMEYSFRGRDL
ncbi:hypothetical protein [Synechococcus sp. PCC 7336]|uniref:hypothetical protein n=1 Tax=Synechococcus sp. PCC 7336 TaxID=195250 RepID=UPI00034B3A89|nr:hypothetical protein [Synechococcus sp. PCC 7336]